MASLSGSPYVELRLDAAGKLAAGDGAALQAAVGAAGVGNVVVLSHGWKFQPPGPRLQYEALWPRVVPGLGGKEGEYLVAGVVWPSKRYTVGIDASRIEAAPAAAGALAAGGDGEAPPDLSDAELAAALDDALDGFEAEDGPLAEAVVAYRANPGRSAADALLQAVAAASSLGAADVELARDRAGLKDLSEDIDGALGLFAQPPRLEPTPEAAQTLGLGDAVRGFFTGPRAAVIRLLEQFSYFEMKIRAGDVGNGLGSVLSGLDPPRETQLHLVGHSFGARVVTAAAAAFQKPPRLSLFSLTLLQGAFSHNGLSAARRGAYHSVVGKPSGPITISHTHKDWACTVMYATASRVSRDTRMRFGGADDRFGSMGANGAQFDAAETAAGQGGAGAPFASPTRGRITNFRADGYINDHNDITNDSVGALIAAALRA